MTFNDDAQLDTSQVGGGGGGGGFRPGGMVIGGGGGCLTLIVVLVMMFLNGGLGGGGSDTGSPGTPMPRQSNTNDPFSTSEVGGGGSVTSSDFSQCKTGADANRDDTCRIIGTVNSVQNYWSTELPAETDGQRKWRMTKTIIYRGTEQSGCGPASNQVGPFYCPLDKQVYIDASFFGILSKQYGSSNGALAQEYVVAHEYGHALQDQLGLLNRAQQDPKGPESGGVRIELMADCFAGMWAKHASTTKDANGTTLLKPLTQKDIDAALSAATAVGDDHIMKTSQGRVSPENFTHGTSEQRRNWFMTGYQGESINSCDTFKATKL